MSGSVSEFCDWKTKHEVKSESLNLKLQEELNLSHKVTTKHEIYGVQNLFDQEFITLMVCPSANHQKSQLNQVQLH